MRRYWIAFFMLFAGVAFAQDDGVGDPFYPQMGNTGYDVQQYTIDLDVDVETNTIFGTTTIDALATSDLSTFNLDLQGLEVTAVTVNDETATYTREGQELIITPPVPINADSSFTTTVTYRGTPQPVRDPGVPFIPLGWQFWNEGYIAAVSQPSGAMSWFPSNNHPTDKAAFTFRITVDAPNVVAANGYLEDLIETEDGKRTYIWVMDDPMATYLSIVAIGEFEIMREEAPNGIPIRNYFPVGTDQSVIDVYANTGAMMVYVEEILGAYPYDVYGVVAVPGFPAALETQTLSIFGANAPDEATVMHELLHQWIGNSVTVAEWQDIWLHEGFATYFQALWAEETLGTDAYHAEIQGYYNFAQNTGMPAPGTPTVEQLFGGAVYFRGALVLHALRVEVGDEVFFQILNTFYQENKHSTATTEDFINTAETVSDRDLENLFEAWLFSDVLPPLP